MGNFITTKNVEVIEMLLTFYSQLEEITEILDKINLQIFFYIMRVPKLPERARPGNSSTGGGGAPKF